MSLLCALGLHQIGSPVTRNGQVHWKCYRCQGVRAAKVDLPVLIDLERPAVVVTQAKPRGRIFWLREIVIGGKHVG